MADLKKFKEEFKRLEGWNKFEPKVFDGLEAHVIFSSPDGNSCADSSGTLRARITRNAIYLKVECECSKKQFGRDTDFIFKTNDFMGRYDISRETTFVEDCPCSYEFSIKNEAGFKLKIIGPDLYDSD